MIWVLLSSVPIEMVRSLGNLFGRVDTLPVFFGVDVDFIFLSAMNNFALARHFFPPFDLLLSATLFIVGFEISIRLIRMIPIIGKVVPQD